MVAEATCSASTMVVHHVTVPKPFTKGVAAEWFRHFNICYWANEWEERIKARKLHTLLEGEALALWVDLSEDEQCDYSKVKKHMLKEMTPMKFASLEEFHR